MTTAIEKLETREITQEEKQERFIEQVRKDMGENGITKALDDACIRQMFTKYKGIEYDAILEYLRKAQLSGADPRLDEIYLVAYGRKTNIIFNYQFIMKKAAESTNLKAIQCICENREVYNPLKKEMEMQLIAVARTNIDGIEYRAEAEFDEFYSKISPTWKNYTKSMLEKCAIVKLCRRIPNTGINDMVIAEENPIYMEDSKLDQQDKADKLLEKFSDE